MTAYAEQLDALGDPTRRRVLELVRDTGPAPVAAIARELPVSRPAVSQHLRVLQDARLVSSTRVGTRNLYVVDPEGIELIRDWLERFWDDALERFKQVADREGVAQ